MYDLGCTVDECECMTWVEQWLYSGYPGCVFDLGCTVDTLDECINDMGWVVHWMSVSV